MRDHDKAEWNGEWISMLAHYDWPEPHEKTYTLSKCDPKSMGCSYWVAADGVCYGLACSNGQTCIAVVEEMIRSAGVRQSYVTFANQNRAAWDRWVKKWSKRTAQPISDPLFSTVKVSINA